MTTAFVLGNGISRRNVCIADLQRHGKIYGCNALYREFTPDVLVATDKPIATHIQEIGYPKKNRFYTRRPIEGLGALTVPREYFGYSSGPIAASIAALDGHRKIYLLGFDMGPTDAQKFNNLYAGTEFYKAVDSQPTFTGNWIKQMCHVIRDFPKTRFYRVYGTTTKPIVEFDSLKNLEHPSLDSFLVLINKQKDL